MTDRDTLETLYRRNLISRRQFVQGLAALGMTAGGLGMLLGESHRIMAADAPAVAQYLVLVVLDAFRPDYLSLAPTPAVSALMRSGAVYDRAWVGQLESYTPVGHASLSTGALPRHDGVIGFEWRNPITKQEALDGWSPGVLAGLMEKDLVASGTSSIPAAVKAADPAATVVALSSEKVYAADAMGGHAADYILYHARTGAGNQTLRPSAVPGHLPPASFFQHPLLQTSLPMRHFTDWDYLSTMLALAAFEQFHPRVLMVNLPGADVYGHAYGGPADPLVFKQIVAGIDRNIARIVGAYKQAGIYDETLFIVTADHGMVPNTRYVDGDTTKAVVSQSGGQYLFHTGGTAADIYLRNYWHARGVAKGMLDLPNVAASYYQVNNHGQYQYVAAPGLKIDPNLDAAYQYLLSSFAGPTAPDVVTPFRENTIGRKYPAAHGDHGGMNWGVQHIPLILSGPGVRQGTVSHFPARLIDVAPTALHLLGLSAPSAMDGNVLADALLNAPTDDVAAQTALSGSLTGYQDALIFQAANNQDEDRKKHRAPPAPAPPVP